MPLSPGDTLGPYTIRGLLGKGGMGEVYRAYDPRLNREVAIKTSAQRFRERFDREARAIAALNHPNICQIYDIGPNYLVMELVEGDAPKGPMAVEDLLRIANQIVAALEAAHAKSITHRDLKPANIKITPQGVVKVLDFGLAKFGGAAPAAISEDSPTLSMAATQAGMILGTAAYMAPEQARGKPVDHRADIWAFGVVLYELLTGERLFKGEDLTETLASVVKEKPDLTAVPRPLRRALAACLEKDPAKRLQAIGDVRLLWEADDAPAAPVPAVPQYRVSRTGWAAAGLLTLATGAALWAPWRAPSEEPPSVEFTVEPPADTQFANAYGAFSISPDGRHLVFAASPAGSLWIRSLDSVAARPLPGTTGANYTFWSPDSKSIAFRADTKLKRIDIAGGAPLVLADAASEPGVTSTGTWSQEGVILFGSPFGLYRVASSGGGATLLTQADSANKEFGHGYPQFLPDGRRFLFYVSSGDTNVQGVYASSLDQPKQRTLILRTNAKAVYVPPKGVHPGYLLWMQESGLLAQVFDADSLKLTGDPFSVTPNVDRNPTNTERAAYWASDAGVLIQLSGYSQANRHITWMDANGKPLGDAMPPGRIVFPRLSPDGTRLAVQRAEGGGDVAVWEFARGVSTRLTFEPEQELTPVWSPDGRQIAYQRAGIGIYRVDASGAGKPELVMKGGAAVLDWGAKHILYRLTDSETGRDIWAVPAAGGEPFPVVVAPADQFTARFSPDGKWVAYSSQESGTGEVYIQPFAEPGSTGGGGRWQVSNAGGGDIAWRRDGRELYYEAPGGDIMAAAMEPEGTGLKISAPRLVGKSGSASADLHSFDATSDGKRFVIQMPPDVTGNRSALTVVTNWRASLKK